MKILLTGATGFLGKELLEILLLDPKISEIWVTSRNHRTHPSPKVRVFQLNLADPAQVSNFEMRPDAVIHLAGLYDFEESYESCYTQNLLPALHLVKKIRNWNEENQVPIYFASTYAVTYGQSEESAESPLKTLPPTAIPYAYTKALAERVITDAQIPSAIFRLGILVGNSKTGATDKLDGAYSFLKLIDSTQSLTRVLKNIPIPAKPDGILPLVPVDSAARVFHQALFNSECAGSPSKIYGVYDDQSIPIRAFAESVLKIYAPGVRAVFVPKTPQTFLNLAGRFSPVSADAFKFALNPVQVRNDHFRQCFPEALIPHFSAYEKAFYSGYRLVTRGTL
jgi:nucleoside-diphosphate-sugar epimerase